MTNQPLKGRRAGGGNTVDGPQDEQEGAVRHPIGEHGRKASRHPPGPFPDQEVV